MSRLIFWSDMFLDTPSFVADGFFVQNALSGSVNYQWQHRGSDKQLWPDCCENILWPIETRAMILSLIGRQKPKV